jgi:putative acetyltransferase
MNSNSFVRRERSGDRPAVGAINVAAFGQPDEADLIEGLRTEGAVLLSLVAELDGRPIGHILFSRMWIDTSAGPIDAVALAPMAVLPEFQRHGIGGKMILAGLDLLREQGERIVIVLGHPAYYPRFGFSTEKAGTLTSPFPKDAFMALELQPGTLEGVQGAVRYAAAFGHN